MNLIDKDVLIVEIEKFVDKCEYHEGYDCGFHDGIYYTLDELKEKINTLEVKEVDLEKACEWLGPVFKDLAGYYSGAELLDDFKNYMKGE